MTPERRREDEELNSVEPTLSMAPQEFGPNAAAIGAWGPFRLLEKVGQGSFGEVYRAFDTVLEREVALKLLLPGRLAQGEEALREARSMAKVRHPNVVPVYGVDRHDGRPGFWSDFVHGKTLSELLSAQGPFGPREVALIGIDVAKALGAVHAARMLHRDIKASNVMREAGGRILLMDFGLTHQRNDGGQFSGTLPYMAPEMLTGKPASVASDIYAVGVLLYYLLTGKYPFEENSVAALRAAHEAGARRRLMDERPDSPEQLAHVIEKAIDPDPDRRYSSSGELIAALSEATGLSSTAVSLPANLPANRGWRRSAGVVVVVMGLALGAAFYISGHRGQKLPSGAGAQADYDTGQTLLDRYYKAGNIDSAIALFQKTVKENPQFASGYAGLGRAWWEKYRDKRDSSSIEPARAASSQAIELDREIPSAHVTLGLIYTNAGKTDLAAGELKEALRLNSRSADAYSALADLYKEEGRTADVEPAIQKAIDFAPGAWRYLNQLGLYYLSTGNYAAAAQQFQQATALNSDNAHAWNNLALAYLRQYRLDQARTACENSLRIEPTYYPSLSNLGEVLEFEGRNAEAVEVYRRAVAVNPSSYMSWGNLASAQNRIPGGKPQARETYLKAISVAEQARAKAPDDPGVVATLGSFYAGVGVDGKSTPMLRQAAALAPDNPQILYKVAEGYELLHRRADALQWIGKAIQAGLPRETVERNPELAALKADPAFPSGK